MPEASFVSFLEVGRVDSLAQRAVILTKLLVYRGHVAKESI